MGAPGNATSKWTSLSHRESDIGNGGVHRGIIGCTLLAGGSGRCLAAVSKTDCNLRHTSLHYKYNLDIERQERVFAPPR